MGLPGAAYELNVGVYTHTMHIYVNMYICRYMYIYICVCIYKGTCIYTYKGLTYLYVCVCVPHVCSCPQKSEKASDTLDLGLQEL